MIAATGLGLAPPVVTPPTTDPGGVVGAGSGTSAARRVVAIAPVLSGYLTIDAGAEHVVGATALAFNAGSGVSGLLRKIYPDIANIAPIGATSSASTEEVLRLAPDVIFVGPAEKPQWQLLGIPGLRAVRMGSSDEAQRKREIWLEMGRTAGKEPRALEIARGADEQLRSIRTRFAPTAVHPAVRVMALYAESGANWILAGRYHSLGDKLQAIGGILEGGNFTAQMDAELLFLLDPEVILLTGMQQGDGEDAAVEMFLRNPAYGSLRAAKTGRVYAIPVFTFLNEPVEDPLLLEWLGEILHPGVGPCPLREQYRLAYRSIYRYVLSDDEIDAALWLDRNRHSAGYGRFRRDAAGMPECSAQLGQLH
jgi:iron complex transport system substrate-binding protein